MQHDRLRLKRRTGSITTGPALLNFAKSSSEYTALQAPPNDSRLITSADTWSLLPRYENSLWRKGIRAQTAAAESRGKGAIGGLGEGGEETASSVFGGVRLSGG